MQVRFDWLTFTIQNDLSKLDFLVHNFFDLSLELFTPCRGRYGYSKGYFYENITILTEGGCDNMGICFDISGKGCTYLYSIDTFDFEDMFKKINSLGGNITRLDTALDCFDNQLNYHDIAEAVAKHNYSSRWKKVKVITSYSKDGIGFDAQFGSRRSDIMLRIYDKKVESSCTDKDYWCRLELQCRNDLAHSFADTFLNREKDYDYIELFLGVLCHYLRFIDRIYDDTNTSKCPTLPWWESFIENVRKTVILRHDICSNNNTIHP